MKVRTRVLPIALVAVLAAAAGTAWAVTQTGEDSGARRIVPPSGKLASGTTPSGAAYTVSRIDASAIGEPEDGTLCTQVATPAAGTRGCDPVPDADGRIHGQPWRPSFAQLGPDRFFTAVEPKGVSSMEVRVAGHGEPTRSRSIDAGAEGQLLLVVVAGRQVASSDPTSSRDYEVRLLDANGETVHKMTMSDS
jgi:hypothetical protein